MKQKAKKPCGHPDFKDPKKKKCSVCGRPRPSRIGFDNRAAGEWMQYESARNLYRKAI